MPAGSSFTVYFWAKTFSLSARSPPYLSGIDSEQNICFVMRGGRAWLQKKDMVRQLQSPDPGSATGPQPEEDDGAASLRLAVELPPVAADLIEAGAWSFYGLAVDVGRRVVRYAVNGDVKESPLGEGEWGCNSLDFLINTGPDAHFSPPRVLDEPLSPGSMQRLYLEARYSFLSIYVGEIKSRLERLAPEEREFSGYSARMVALAPPIVFQKRGTGSSGQAPQCQGKTMEQFNARFLERRSWKCDTPYTCTESISCYAESASASTDSFFGQQAVELEPGENYFPGFAWALEGDSIVRDGKVLNPKADYIDSMTEVVKMYIPFFVPATKVATIAVVAVDISDVKPSVSHEFLQQKILSDSEITWVVGFAVAGIVFACIGVVLAFPAAIQELRDFKHNKLKWMSKKLKRVTPSRLVRLPALRNRRYTANTTQPDVLDVALNTGLVILLVVFVTIQVKNNSTAEDIFTSIAGISWSGNLEFQEKVDVFLDAITRAVDVVSSEASFITFAFWMLVLCCVRMIVYMKIHPSISSIAETFERTSGELVNFLLSFGAVYLFLAFIAHVRFGYLYDEFSTIEQSLITQFSLLIGDSSPDYTTDALMCIYVVGFVFICSLALLNFLLAIVVNGYTRVTEKVLENRVARTLPEDLLSAAVDGALWAANPNWPSKLAILRTLRDTHPDVFSDAEEVVRPIGRDAFLRLISEASGGRASQSDGNRLFRHYARFEVMLTQAADEGGSELESDPGRLEP
uniref:Ion transport domain-containing protein n=1 Tax=Tetraselmis sp. GSL018 TaxID=582737 RepID=A0A061R8S4_9CHLO